MDNQDRAIVPAENAVIVGYMKGGKGRRKRPLNDVIAPWLDEVRGLSGSRESDVKYTATMRDFLALLATAGLTLESDPSDVATLAQAFAGRRAGDGRRDIANTTYNQRLGILSSFYRFAIQRGYSGGNPIDHVKRRRVQQYAGAHALDEATVGERLAAIPRDTLAGKRDYALLTLALMTGRRREELRTFTWGQIERRGPHRDELLVTWRAKGGKIIQDLLESGHPHTVALLDWLTAFYGDLDALTPETPIFVSLHRGYRGRALSCRAMATIYEHRLGVSKVHTTRHTFATSLEKQGARVSEIQARLGHASLATTSRYLSSLTSDRNPYAEGLARALGIG